MFDDFLEFKGKDKKVVKKDFPNGCSKSATHDGVGAPMSSIDNQTGVQVLLGICRLDL